MKTKRIFTFWEPQNNVPSYLSLCMKTWKIYLSDYEIIILNYSNLDYWLEKGFINTYLNRNFSYALQSDIIRCAILCKHGGIWIDIDTIFTSEEFIKYFDINSDFILIAPHICFICADKNSVVLKKWNKRIKTRIKFYKKAFSYGLFSKYYLKIFKKDLYKKLINWSYFGNDILNPLFKKYTNKKDVYLINRMELGCMPELLFDFNKPLNIVEKYRKFYFEEDNSNFAYKTSKGIILLHNSWTPNLFKSMTEKEFLSSNNTLAVLLKRLTNRKFIN